jgi:uncharacterized membrane protein YeaQ/YmgE (transglycosylase-associated protein family)
MQKSKARTLVRVLLAVGIIIGLIGRFLMEDGPQKTTIHNISSGIVIGAFLFLVLAYIKPEWFADKPKNDTEKF